MGRSRRSTIRNMKLKLNIKYDEKLPSGYTFPKNILLEALKNKTPIYITAGECEKDLSLSEIIGHVVRVYLDKNPVEVDLHFYTQGKYIEEIITRYPKMWNCGAVSDGTVDENGIVTSMSLKYLFITPSEEGIPK